MKVLVIATTFPRWKDDSTPKFVFDLSKRLADKFDLIVLAPHFYKAKKYESMDNLRVYRFSYFFPTILQKVCYGGGIAPNVKRSFLAKLQVPFLFISEFLSVKKLIKKEKIELIHAHWVVPQGFIARIIKKFYGVPYIVTVHGSDIFGLKGRLFQRIQKSAIKNSLICTVNSNATKNEVVRRFPDLKEKIRLVPMGVDASLFKKKKISKNKLGYGNYNLLLFVGRLSEQKGIEYLIKSMPDVLSKFHNTKLLIIGEGGYKNNFMKKVKELHLGKNVEFLSSVSRSKLIDYYNIADLFVYPSLAHKTGTEALGVVLLEALSCGTAVIGSDVGGIRDIIKNKKTGLLTKQRNEKDIADKIVLLLKNKKLREKLAKEGQKFVRQNYSWPIIIKKFKEIYKKVK